MKMVVNSTVFDAQHFEWLHFQENGIQNPLLKKMELMSNAFDF